MVAPPCRGQLTCINKHVIGKSPSALPQPAQAWRTMAGCSRNRDPSAPKVNASAHILVVDDEPDITAVLSRYLSRQGYKVSTASSGAAMRTVLADAPVDLVLLDLGLPDEDGLSLMRELR